jgi:DNA-directed RNA polymerase subunit M/transcription elongation factor TFIIS
MYPLYTMNNLKDPVRVRSVNKLNTLLDDITKSRIIEQSYNYCITIAKEKNIYRDWNNSIFKNLYMQKIMSIYLNINKKSYLKNKSFHSRIMDGKIELQKISSMSNYDIFPDNWKDIIEKKCKQDKLKYELKPEAMSTLFKCRKCGSRETSYYEVQTRSADEPMTQFVTCIKCNNKWKE